MTPSANEPTFEPPSLLVRQLTLDAGASRVQRPGEHAKTDELWLGNAYDPTNPDAATETLYLRVGSAPVLVAELVCGRMAHLLGLPAPEVFLVTVLAGTLPDSKLCPPETNSLYVGTRDVGGQTFSQLLDSNSQATARLLNTWPALGQVAAFDEWLANVDRNMGNLLYVAQTIHIIDHAEAFGGTMRTLFPLAELTETEFENKLARVLGALDPSRRMSILSDLGAWLKQTAGAMDVAATVRGAVHEALCNTAQHAELVDFIRRRLTITHRLLCNRLGHPQLQLQTA